MNEAFFRKYFLQIQELFDIEEDIFEYITEEVLPDESLMRLVTRRDASSFSWPDETPLGGPGTSLNSFVLYSLIRHYDMKKVIETGVSGGMYTSFLLSALNKNGGYLRSLELSDDKNIVGHLIPESIKSYKNWDLITGQDSLIGLKRDDVDSFDFYCHDSLHTMRHMTKEIIQFLRCNNDRFFLFIDDQDAEMFWKRSMNNNLFRKKGYNNYCISGNETEPLGHLGGFVKYEKI